MTSRLKAGAVTLMAVLGLLLGGAGLASAAPAGTVQPTATAAARPVVKDCNPSDGSVGGCTYYNPNNNTFRVCDKRDGLYTIGRFSINGNEDAAFGLKVSDGGGCSDGLILPARTGDRVCIRTGWENHGYTQPECVRL